MRVGIHKIGNELYHSGPGLSSSDIKELLKSPAHFNNYKANPIEPTAEMLRGTLVHALILEPETFDSQFAVGDFNIRRGKDYDKVCQQNQGKLIISRAELDEAALVVEAFFKELNANPELKALSDGIKETAFYWEETETGILCKAKPDIITARGQIVDLKTARDASFDAFQRAIVDMQYFVSAAFYLRGVKETPGAVALLKQIPTEFYFIAIETKAPYAIAIYKLDAKAIEIGNSLIERALNSYSEAIATAEWRSYSRVPIEMGLPNYVFYKYNYSGFGGAR